MKKRNMKAGDALVGMKRRGSQLEDPLAWDEVRGDG